MAGQRTRNALLTLAAIVATLLSQSAAVADEAEVAFDIESQELGSALTEFALQSGKDILFVEAEVAGKSASGISGRYVPTAALELLLADSNLNYRLSALDTVLVSEAAGANGGDSDSGNGRRAGARQRPVMMAQASAEQSQSRRTETDSDEDEIKRPLEEIIVTGTNIRGIAPESSPVRIFDREDVQISGAATAQDFVQTLTANFGGGSNADLPFGLPTDASASFNSGVSGSLGSSINLRGLGSGSTLVLLNGHRLAPSSGIGDFTDISMIPASAIERVEVLTDGASSIYGSDAVAGVVNFILRDDFEGVETSLRYGVGTQNSSPEEFRASITRGLNWDSGHALLSYEYFNQDEIGAQDRVFSQGALLPNDLQPSQERHSVLASLSQDLTSNVESFADITFSRRLAIHDATLASSGLPFRSNPASEALNISAGGVWKVADSWVVNLSATYSAVDTRTTRTGALTARRDVDSKAWISDIKTSRTVLQLPGGDLKLAIGGQFRTEHFRSFDVLDDEVDREADRDVYAAFGEVFIPIVGPNNALPGIERLELNVSGRYDDYSDFGSAANPKVGVLWSPFEALRFRGSYSTSFNPPPLGRVGAFDLRISAFETSFINALLGLTAADPTIADVVQLNVTGTDKNLDAENSRALAAGLDVEHQWGRHGITISGTWFEVEFENRLGQTPVPGFPGPLGQFVAPNIAFNDPSALPEGTVIFFPSADQITDVLNSADTVLANNPPSLGDPFTAQIINFTSLTRNISLTKVSGLDFNLAYTYNSDSGDLLLGIDGSYLDEFKQQAASTTPKVNQVNTLYNPVDWKLRGHVGYLYSGFAANVFLNFINDYREDNTADAGRIDSRTTVDLSLSYDTQNHMNDSVLNDTVLRLSVLNLFDEAPPSTPSNASFGIFGYDPANASPLGRFIAFELTKRF